MDSTLDAIVNNLVFVITAFVIKSKVVHYFSFNMNCSVCNLFWNLEQHWLYYSFATGCECETGWSGEDCSLDVNECDRSSPPCEDADSVCINVPGSFRCQCKQGFYRNSGTCVGKISYFNIHISALHLVQCKLCNTLLQ